MFPFNFFRYKVRQKKQAEVRQITDKPTYITEF